MSMGYFGGRGDENVLKLIAVMVAQPDYAKSHLIISFKGVSCMVCELNKAVKNYIIIKHIFHLLLLKKLNSRALIFKVDVQGRRSKLEWQGQP